MAAPAVEAMAEAFELVARDLTLESNGGAITQSFRGVLRNPTSAELQGGLVHSARVVIARASTFTAAGITPRKYDRILDPQDPGRVYSIEEDPTWLYAGSSRLWWRGVVVG